MGLYDEFRDLATTLLVDEFGVPATLNSITKTYDPLEGAATETVTALPCFAVIAPRRLVSEDGRIIVETIARLNIKPAIGDTLTMGTTTYTIETVEEVAPDGGEPMLYMSKVAR